MKVLSAEGELRKTAKTTFMIVRLRAESRTHDLQNNKWWF